MFYTWWKNGIQTQDVSQLGLLIISEQPVPPGTLTTLGSFLGINQTTALNLYFSAITKLQKKKQIKTLRTAMTTMSFRRPGFLH